MMVQSLRYRLAADGWRFGLAGAANTLTTLVIYQLLLFFVPAWLAYAISWLVGFSFVVIFYPSRVFAGARRDAGARLWFGVAYVVVFFLGLGLLRFAIFSGLPPSVAIFGVMAVTTAVNFGLGRWLLTRPAAKRSRVSGSSI